MSDDNRISTLWFALLGLVKMQPSTGYQLRKIFQDTPMARYSSSPGAIYPALQNLESRNLIRSQSGLGKTGRSTQTFYCTATGSRRLVAWLRADVTSDAVYQELDVVLLRFSFLDLVGDLDWSIEFLHQFRTATLDCSEQVKKIRKGLAPAQPLHGQLALSNGVAVFEAHAEWATFAIAAIKRQQRKSP